jgi:hypothetical protein
MLIAALILAVWYGFFAAYCFCGTCTMGSTNAFMVGTILGMPASAIAVALVIRARARATWQSAVVLGIAVLALLVLVLWVPTAISVGIHGHSLCGPEFDGYLDVITGRERMFPERLIPLAHVLVAAALLVCSLRSALDARRTAHQ